MNRRNSFSHLHAASIVAVIAFVLYLPTLQYQFVNWDDGGYVTTNEALAFGWRDFLAWAFTTFQQGNWHPLTWVSLKLDHAIWGLNPFGYHLSNIILHALNSFLVVLLMWRLFIIDTRKGDVSRGLVFAFSIGVIFAIHPLHVESVAWVSERKDLLYSVFYLLSILTWVAWVQKPGNRNLTLYITSFLFYVLSLMSKPMAVSLPVVLILLDIYPLRRTNQGFRIIIEKIPFIAVTLVSSVITILAQSYTQSVAPLVDLALFDRLGNAARAFFFYIYKGFFPADLSPLYKLRIVDSDLFLEGMIAGILLIVLFAFATIRLRKSPQQFVLLSMFAVMLLPTLGIVQVGSQFAADRYMYLSIIPLAVAACILVCQLSRKVALPTLWSVTLAMIAGVILAFATSQQMMHWQTSESLWKKVIAEDYEVPTAHYNLGNYYLGLNQLAKAEPEWQVTVQLDPGHSWGHNQLGNLYFFRGDLEAAFESYKKAVHSDPENIEARFNYAQVLDQQGKSLKARDAYSNFVNLATPEYQQQVELALSRIRQIGSTNQP